MPNIKQPFEIETDASDYAMREMLMQIRKPICFHSETFSKIVMGHPTYDKELYAMVPSVKK